MNSDNLFTGHGSPMPVSRVVNAGFFGTVDDAFASRSLHFPGRPETLDCGTICTEKLALTQTSCQQKVFTLFSYNTNIIL